MTKDHSDWFKASKPTPDIPLQAASKHAYKGFSVLDDDLETLTTGQEGDGNYSGPGNDDCLRMPAGEDRIQVTHEVTLRSVVSKKYVPHGLQTSETRQLSGFVVHGRTVEVGSTGEISSCC